MRIDMSGQHAVVSGSTVGIGYAIANGLAKAGATVTINGAHSGARRFRR
jgi:NAD(P)-dependent dehydrogenase (short-subunit alcohol dehydrogenase family)